MNRKPIVKKKLLQSQNIILIFAALAVLMFASALIELNQSKKELFDLMEKHAHFLLETVLVSSTNTLLTNEHLESFLEERLLNNASFIRYLYEKGQISNSFLAKFARENNIYRINIFGRNGKKYFSSHKSIHVDKKEKVSPDEILKPIFEAEQDTLIIGLKEARFVKGYRYAIAIATRDRNAIVLNLNAENLLNFRKQIGFGTLLREIINNPGIVYIALQDTAGIIAASGNIRELERINDSSFLWKSLQDSSFDTRISEFNSLEVFEAVHPFYYGEISVGLFRLGLSLEPLNHIKARINRRIIIITIILFVIGFIVFTLIIARQKLYLLKKQYQVVETYSGSIIRNVSDAIVVLDEKGTIKIFNHAAEELFQKNEQEVLGNTLLSILNESRCGDIVLSSATMQQIECDIKSRKVYILVSKAIFKDENGIENTILVIRDLTEQRKMEAQIQRQQRLTAMGELASGVAHEIRNPLNTIGTIIQQLEKDFEPRENSEEYRQLARLVYQEVRRINETVQDFLRFARPEPIQPHSINLPELFNSLYQQYKVILDEHNIKFYMNLDWKGAVHWDERQMRQVFVNLIQNAIDAIGNNGKIIIYLDKTNDNELEIVLKDNGPGIAEDIRSKIFNLYFTTKAKGTGIGLAIVQRIIYEHGGIIHVESDSQSGTSFILTMPIRITEER